MKPSEQSPIVILGLSPSEPGKSAAGPNEMHPSLGDSVAKYFVHAWLVAWLALVCILAPWIVFTEFNQTLELASRGHSTNAVVDSCQKETRRFSHTPIQLLFCDITYDGYAAHIDATEIAHFYDVSPGQQFPVLYLPDEPSVVLAGDPGDSASRLLMENQTGLDLFGSVAALVFPVVVLVAVLSSIRGDKRSKSSAPLTRAYIPGSPQRKARKTQA